MRTLTKFVGGAVFAAVILTGCVPAEPVQGTVVDKEYDKPTTKKVAEKCSGTGKKRKCTPATTKKTKAEWELMVETADGEIVEVEVSETEYNQYAVGDAYDSESK